VRVALVVVVLALVGCGQDPIGVRREATDYHHGELIAAVDTFVAAGRTAAAYAELARTIDKLRPGMDRTVADEAELKLVVLALGPVQAAERLPAEQRIAALSLTVWPTLLGPPVEAQERAVRKLVGAADYPPRPGEASAAYLERLCGGVLATECKRTIGELRGEVVGAIAIERATERVRNAVGSCVVCASDPGWRTAIHDWEALDRASNTTRREVERRADPATWPVAGTAAVADPLLPEAEVDELGELHVDGVRYDAGARRGALRTLRGDGDAIALHVRPGLTLAQARGLLVDARAAGVARVAVLARADRYPYGRRAYWIADGSGPRASLRPTDTIQLLLHTVDVIQAPGTVARLD
jgi:hypothetical protein